MSKRYFLLTCILFLCYSCGTVVKTLLGFKNPKVENKVELSEYFAKVISNEDTFFMKVDEIGNEVEIFTKFGLGFSSDILLFSKDGKKYCYLGTEECGGVQMSKAFQEFNENYAPCVGDEDMNLNTYLENITDLKAIKFLKIIFLKRITIFFNIGTNILVLRRD
jgi:hypothetical protein